MAKTQADILQLQIGGLVMQLADVMSQLEHAREEIAALKAPAQEAKPQEAQELKKFVREPDKIGPRAAAENYVAQAPQEVKK